MKRNRWIRLIGLVVSCTAMLAVAVSLTLAQDSQPPTTLASTLGTGFTYQGQLKKGSTFVTGSCDFQFSLWDSLAGLSGQVGSTQTKTGISVSNGLFTIADLDFGAAAFTGEARWLQVAVKCAGDADFVPFAARQPITPAPYALYSPTAATAITASIATTATTANSAPWSGLSGVPAPLISLTNPSPCSNGQVATWNGTTWICQTVSSGPGDITGVYPGTGLTGGGASGEVTLTVAFGGNGSASTAARSDHDHNGVYALVAHVHSGADITSGTIDQARIDPLIARDSEITPTVWANDGSGSGLDADLLDGQHANAFQTRVSGSCAVGSSVRAINADGTVDCWSDAPLNRASAPAANISTTVDSAGNVGFTPSVTIGADGLPIVSYGDNTNGNLKILHCGNLACNSNNIISTVDAGGTGAMWNSIVLGTDGLPINTYVDYTNRDLKVLHCGNLLCSSGNISTTLDSAGNIAQDGASITIGADGLPVVSYSDYTNGDLKVLHCGNFACSSGNISTTVDSAGAVGGYSSITLGTDGLPVVSYTDYTHQALKVLHCGNLLCTSGNISSTVDSAYGVETSITLGADGLPLISYLDDINIVLKVLHCGNLLCTSGNISTTVDGLGIYSSITLGADSLPIVSYLGLPRGLTVLHCGNALCNSGNITSTLDNSVAIIGDNGSLTIGADGLPVISYLDGTNSDLKVLHCSNTLCTPYFRRR